MMTSLLIKYLTGECSEKEKQYVEDWLAEDVQNKKYLKEIKTIWCVEPKEEFRPHILKAWEKVESRIIKKEPQTDFSFLTNLKSRDYYRNRKSKYRFAKSIIFSVAAVFIIVFVFALNWVKPVEKKAFVMQEVKTEKGQRTTFTLSDGSRVTLNADSKIEIPSTFTSDNRELFLDGEAFFEVKSDKEHPFIVYSKSTFTHVLGTKFSISSYEKDDKVRTVVQEGRVLVGLKDSLSASREITKNEVAELSSKRIEKLFYTEDLDQFMGWKDGKLIFENAPFDQVVKKLERWYDIEIQVSEPLQNTRLLTAQFETEPLTEVLNVVSLTLNLAYTREKRLVTFAPKK